ncbi:MAG: hypothetical protein ACTSUN_01065 [Promethearchaeota archaeon]
MDEFYDLEAGTYEVKNLIPKKRQKAKSKKMYRRNSGDPEAMFRIRRNAGSRVKKCVLRHVSEVYRLLFHDYRST